MTTPFREADRDYLVYEYSRPVVAEMNPKYLLPRNWDLDTAIDAIRRNEFAFPVLQLQADSDPYQPAESFADIATACPNVEIE